MKSITDDKVLALDRIISESANIVTIAHTHPDGDALGCTTALCSYLSGVRGKKAVPVYPDCPPTTLEFLYSRFDIVTDPEEAAKVIAGCDLLVCMDFNKLMRVSGLSQAVAECKARKVMIDHHIGPETELFELVFSETEISSASELLFHILLKMPDVAGDATRLPAECCRSLMTGMTTDTNNFANSVYPSTLMMASTLLAAGVDRDEIVSSIFNSSREQKLKGWSWLLSNKLRLTDFGVAYMVMTAEESQMLELLDGETEGLVNQPLQIKRIKISAFIREENGKFRISLRSKKEICVNALAEAFFHGGGHAQAAGGDIFFPDDCKKEEVEEYFRNIAARFVQNGYVAIK